MWEGHFITVGKDGEEGGMVAPTSGVGSNKVYDSKAKVHNKKNVKEKERKPVGGSIHQR